MNIEKWLEARGLDIETATKYGVRQEGEWIAFPYLQQGKEIYRKLRSMTDKNFRCAPTGVPQNLLWNEDCLAEAPAKGAPLIITEGEMDCLAILQAGFHHVVSVPSGAKMAGQNQNVARFLGVQSQNDGQDGPKMKPHIEPFSKIILAVDCDAAGLELRRALAEFLEAEFCWVPA